MIYLDNAATSFFKPPCVIDAVSDTLKNLSANPGRGGHFLSLAAASLVHKARTALLEFLNLECGQIVFTHNCTHALNAAILGTVQRGGHIITTCYEHNSVLRPLFELERRGIIELSVVEPIETLGCNPCPQITAADISKHINCNTYMIAITHISNVTGTINPIKQIGRLCKNNGILFLVDAAQSAGHVPIDMAKSNIDMISLAPHKGLYAPQGIGVLALREGLTPTSTVYGGTGTDSTSLYQPLELPESLEAGTLATPAIAGLLAGIEYAKKHMAEHAKQISDLTAYTVTELSKIDGIKIYSMPTAADINTHHTGIISFNINNLHSADAAQILSTDFSICVRGGLHCAPLAHKYLNTLSTGLIRASLGSTNTKEQLDTFIAAAEKLAINNQ